MAKPKFNLTVNPTFKAPVNIAIPGGKAVDVEFTFKYRNKDELKEFVDEMKGKTDVVLIEEMASGWELDDPFNAESLEKLTQNYPGSSMGITQVYISELQGVRAKN
jgi:hypothetical protein